MTSMSIDDNDYDKKGDGENGAHKEGDGKNGGGKGRASVEEENKRQAALQEWLDKAAVAKIAAALEDAALPFIESDAADDEQLESFDLTADYDPIVDLGAGSRVLSEEIKHAAATFHISEKRLKELLTTRTKEKSTTYPKTVSKEPTGTPYGRSFLSNRHGVWFRQAIAGVDTPYVWRRITKTQIDLDAMSYDTTRRRNWQHRYLVTNETGQFPVDIPNESTGKDAGHAIKISMSRCVRVVETPEARQQLAKFLQIWPKKRIVRAPRTGWLECGGQWVFVLPDEVIGATDNMYIIVDGTIRSDDHGFHIVGTSDQWRDHVATPLAGNSNVVLAMGTMLAGPLLRFAGESGGGFHFHDKKQRLAKRCARWQHLSGNTRHRSCAAAR